MPTNLNAQCRYSIIDRCLKHQVKKYWTLQEIRDKLEEHDISVSKRTLEKDLETMRHDSRLNFYAPISYCRIHHGYYYDKDDYALPFNGLSDIELDTLYCGIEFVKGYEEIEIVRKFGELIERVMYRK